MRLNNKTAIITGAGGLIGHHTAKTYLREGANLVLTDRNLDALKVASKDFPTDQVVLMEADAVSVEQTEAVAAAAQESFGGIDVFFANAGIEGSPQPIPDYDLAVHDHVMDINVKGVLVGLQMILPRMREGGSIILASSIAGLVGSPLNISYSVSKHAVVGLRRSAAAPAGKRGIRVNSLHPGFVESPMLSRLMEQMGDPAEVRRGFTERIKLGKFTEAEDVANTVLFLGSDESRSITDQAIVVDGGVV